MPGVSHRARTQLELEVAESAASESPRRRVPGLPPRQPGHPPRRRAGAGEPPATFPSHPPKKYSLGRGGWSPFFHPPHKEQEEPARDEDVEANLLRPPPCAATLQLRVYRAEDLPQGGHRGGFWEIGGCESGGAPPPTSPHPRCSRTGSAMPSLGATGWRQEGLRGGGGAGHLCRQDGGCWAGMGGGTHQILLGGGSWLCPMQLCTRVMPPDANPTWNEVFFFPLRVR